MICQRESAAVWAAHNNCDETPTEETVGAHVKMEWRTAPMIDGIHYRLNGIGVNCHQCRWGNQRKDC